jgi:hypothetical protein
MRPNLTRTAAAAVLVLALCGAGGAQAIRLAHHDPDLVVDIAPAYREVPPLAFPIETLTDAERRIFVDAGPGRRVRRMLIAQFERVKPGQSFRFVYPPRPPRDFAGVTWRAGAFAYDDAAALTAAPDKEAARTRRHLQALGYRLPRMWKVGRLARVADPQGLTEEILFYLEAADDAVPTELTPDPGSPGDFYVTPAERERLLQALEAAVRPARR